MPRYEVEFGGKVGVEAVDSDEAMDLALQAVENDRGLANVRKVRLLDEDEDI